MTMPVEYEAAAGEALAEPTWAPASDEQNSELRERLLGSARAVFLAHGFHGATVDEIAAGAGQLRPAFYLHFADKAEALCALCEADADTGMKFFQELDAVLVAGSREALRSWIARACAWFRAITELAPAWNETRLVATGVSMRAKIMGGIGELLPNYLALCRPERHREMQLRLVLLVLHLEQVGHLPASDWNAQQELAVDVLTDMWWSVLHPDGRNYPSGCGDASQSRSHSG
jgi:AcrR family transcriptional regulator